MRLRRWWPGGAALAICAGLGLLGRWMWRPGSPVVAVPSAEVSAPDRKSAGGVLDQVLEVMTRGGSAAERAQAIETLDTITRLGTALAGDSRAALLSAIERGSPADMDEGGWAHLFNCACNALAVGRSTPDETLIAILERIAADDRRLVMRLYALQHLGVRYESATPVCQARLRTFLRGMVEEPGSPVAGTALGLCRRWETAAEAGGGSSFARGRAMVEDASRPVDVRVGTLHVIGDDPAVLDLVRVIAPDRSQPVILRKAALNLIGRHGQSRDLDVLRRCIAESPRLAQAGQPAANALASRLSGSPPRVPIPIQ